MVKNVYVVTAFEGADEMGEYAGFDSCVIGVFSSEEKANEAINGETAKTCFKNYEFIVDEWELDDFSWKIML